LKSLGRPASRGGLRSRENRTGGFFIPDSGFLSDIRNLKSEIEAMVNPADALRTMNTKSDKEKICLRCAHARFPGPQEQCYKFGGLICGKFNANVAKYDRCADVQARLRARRKKRAASSPRKAAKQRNK